MDTADAWIADHCAGNDSPACQTDPVHDDAMNHTVPGSYESNSR